MSCRGSPASSRAPQFHRALRRDNGQVVQPFMRVGTYPTRDFATLGILLLPPGLLPGKRWAGHFCRPLHVAMQIGPYLPVRSVYGSGVWSLRIPDFASPPQSPPGRIPAGSLKSRIGQVFPADYPHRTHCHLPLMMSGPVAPDTRTSQHIARFYNGLKSQQIQLTWS